MPVTRISRLGRLLGIGRRVGVDRTPVLALDRPGLVHRLADDVDDAPKEPGPDRHRDRQSGIPDVLAAHEALADVHGDRAHGRFAEMLRHFEHQAVAVVVGFQRIEDRRQLAVEMHVDDGADDLRNAPDLIGLCWP